MERLKYLSFAAGYRQQAALDREAGRMDSANWCEGKRREYQRKLVALRYRGVGQ